MDDQQAGLRLALQHLETEARNIGEEATLRQRFLEAIGDFLEESGISRRNVRLEERIVRGRSDARVGAVIFEIKLPVPQGEGISAAIRQAQGYVHEQRSQQPDGPLVRGVGYDGLTIAFLDQDGNLIADGSPSRLAAKLEAWLLSLAGKAVTPEDVVSRVGSSSSLARDTVDCTREIFASYRDRVGFIDEVFRVWRGLYGCAANLNAEAIKGVSSSAARLGFTLRGRAEVEEYLFNIETYLATLLKLLVARVAVQQRLVPHFTVSSLLQPRPILRFAELQTLMPELSGIFEEDVFHWMIDAARADATIEPVLNDCISSLAGMIDDIDFAGVGSDFLRLVYQRFFDRATRRALGEFYTSPDIVDETLDAAGYSGDIGLSIADISCGSGTFLVRAIDRILERNRHRSPQELLDSITDSVIGIDIHPFAVAMARVNYFLAISELMSVGRPTKIPVHWADSLSKLVPEQERMAGTGAPIPVHIPGLGDYLLPNYREVDWDELFSATKEVLSGFRGAADFDQAWDRFAQIMPSEALLIYETTLREFLATAVERHNANRDMRWLPLLRNVLSLERLRGNLDFVVGNPPWVRIHNIERGLRERLFEDFSFCRDAGWRYGIALSGGGRGFGRQIDLSLAFVEKSLSLLKDGGMLAYVITSKLLHTLYANVWRRTLGQDTTIHRLVDYSLYARPLFEEATNYPLIFAVQKRSPPEEHRVSVSLWNLSRLPWHFDQLQSELSLLRTDAGSPCVLVPSHVLRGIRKMQGGDSSGTIFRNHYLTNMGLRPLMGVKTALNSVFVVKEIAETDSPDEVVVRTEGFYKAGPGDRDRFEARIERYMLRPILRGANTRQWHVGPGDYIIWTHEDTGEVLPELPPRTREFLERHTDDLVRRSDYREGMPVWSIFRVTPEKLQNKVVWHELAKEFEAAFVPAHIDDPMIGHQLVVPLQTVYLVAPEDEALGYVLAGWLNSLPVRVYVMSFGERARGAYFRHISWVTGLLPLPSAIAELMPEAERTQLPEVDGMARQALQNLQRLSRELHHQPEQWEQRAVRESLDNYVANLYGLNDEDMEALRTYYRFVRSAEQLELPTGDEC